MPHDNRPFDRQSYNQNDARAKKAMVNYLTVNNFTDIVDKEDYYFDVSANKKVKGKDEKFYLAAVLQMYCSKRRGTSAPTMGRPHY